MAAKWTHDDLQRFLFRATLAGYAGNGEPSERVQRPEFTEYEFADGLWRYRDSYAGSSASYGQEIAWHDEQPVWTQCYGGEFTGESKHRHETFDFLKLALRENGRRTAFRPRGPAYCQRTDPLHVRWEYACEWEGRLATFHGWETIRRNDLLVFQYRFLGGIIVARDE